MDDERNQCLASPPAPRPLQSVESQSEPLSCSISSQYVLWEVAQQQAQNSQSRQGAQGYPPPVSGTVPVGIGMASVARIPVPGSNGLFIELSPRGWVPKSGSTSTVFIQDAAGKRVLRLDYGYNKGTGTIDYHWNQKGTFSEFGIPDHAPAGSAGEALFKTARYFKYAGCELLGGGGAEGGTVAEPGLGTVIGGLGGCIVGGIAGYAGASWAAGKTYDWVEETFFEPLPEMPAPGH